MERSHYEVATPCMLQQFFTLGWFGRSGKTREDSMFTGKCYFPETFCWMFSFLLSGRHTRRMHKNTDSVLLKYICGIFTSNIC